jgi:hypothetical protein
MRLSEQLDVSLALYPALRQSSLYPTAGYTTTFPIHSQASVDHPPQSSAEVEGRVELFICSPAGPSWDCYRVKTFQIPHPDLTWPPQSCCFPFSSTGRFCSTNMATDKTSTVHKLQIMFHCDHYLRQTFHVITTRRVISVRPMAHHLWNKYSGVCYNECNWF